MPSKRQISQLNKERQLAVNEFNKLVHSVFSTDKGKKLLDMWMDDLIHSPGGIEGIEPYKLGMVEGRKSFIRSILVSMKRAEGKYE